MGETGRFLAADVSQQGSLSSVLGPSQGLHLLKPASPIVFLCVQL